MDSLRSSCIPIIRSAFQQPLDLLVLGNWPREIRTRFGCAIMKFTITISAAAYNLWLAVLPLYCIGRVSQVLETCRGSLPSVLGRGGWVAQPDMINEGIGRESVYEIRARTKALN